ncbi:hypothetical protein QFZ87_003224 [Bacillus sp. SLBN-46]|nr:hypothetical protein [Bacillus sp. SLBN-46]MDR6123627.1 hypothetical protein [Bacillus sp. SLBN-46]
MKDKISWRRVETVLHTGDEGQNQQRITKTVFHKNYARHPTIFFI